MNGTPVARQYHRLIFMFFLAVVVGGIVVFFQTMIASLHAEIAIAHARHPVHASSSPR